MNTDTNSRTISLNIAGRLFSFSGLQPQHKLPDAYSPFFGDDEQGSPAGTYEIVDSLDPVHTKELLWSGPTWRMTDTGDGYQVDLRMLDRNDWIPTANFRHDFSTGKIIPLVGREPTFSEFALNYPLDQILFINRLPRCGAVLLHASGILHEGKIYLFCGRSDIGKTTMARMWRDAGATLLNDDRMLVWIENGSALASPSPWHGEDPEINLVTAPIAGIIHLQQTPEHQLETLNPIQSLSALTATAVLPFYLKESLDYGMDVLHSVAEKASSCRLGFQPTPDVVDFILLHAQG